MFPAFHGLSSENRMCRTLCVVWVKGDSWLVLRGQVTEDGKHEVCLCVCSQSTPSGSDELSEPVWVWRYIWGSSPPSVLKPCVLAFFLSFFFTVVASVFCHPSFCFSEWYGLVSADRFLHSPKPFADSLHCKFSWSKLPLWSSVWLQSDCAVLA